jgi:hypothetical protein
MSYFVICVCLRIAVSNTYCVVFFAVLVFVLCLVCLMLPVSVDCLFLIVPSIIFMNRINETINHDIVYSTCNMWYAKRQCYTYFCK